MKSKLRTPHLVTLCFLLTVAVILLSWLLDAYGITVRRSETGEELRVLSLLSPEGIRWGLRSVVDNFIGFAPVGWGLVLVFGAGVAWYSGFLDASLRLFRRLQTSRKERRALIGAFAVGLVYVGVVLFATFSSWSILRGVSGGLGRSPFLAGLPFLLSLGVSLMGVTYGFASGTFRTDGDIFRAMARPVNGLGIYLVIAFFLAQMLACIRYSGLDRFLFALFEH